MKTLASYFNATSLAVLLTLSAMAINLMTANLLPSVKKDRLPIVVDLTEHDAASSAF